MPVNNQSNQYKQRIESWTRARDVVAGNDAVKSKSTQYLPMPPGLEGATYIGADTKHQPDSDYHFYLSFAELPDIVGPAKDGLVGVATSRDATVKLPSALEHLTKKATMCGLSLDQLWEKLLDEALTVGGSGLLIDIDDDKLPRFAWYSNECRVNHRSDRHYLQMCVLEQSYEVADKNDEFATVRDVEYLELGLIRAGEQLRYASRVWRKDKGGKWAPVVNEDTDRDGFSLFSYQGRAFDYIPFFNMSAYPCAFDFCDIPIRSMVTPALAMYRMTADYRRALYLKGDPIPVLTGVDPKDIPRKIGGGSVWAFANPDADAKYLDIDGNGLPMMRSAIQDEMTKFREAASKLLANEARTPESGAAIDRRINTNQMSLRAIVTALGRKFKDALQAMAVLAGESPESVEFLPDVDFVEPLMQSRELLELMQAKKMGAPLALDTIHSLMARGNMTMLTFEQEMKKIESDPKIVDPDPATGGGADNAPAA